MIDNNIFAMYQQAKCRELIGTRSALRRLGPTVVKNKIEIFERRFFSFKMPVNIIHPHLNFTKMKAKLFHPSFPELPGLRQSTS
jgi:hypothetical protein